MSCCKLGGTATALELHAKSLPEDNGAKMLFPMYTVAVETLLRMTAVQPHEELKAYGELVEFEDSAHQTASFVSHQWMTQHHPDPECEQLKILQGAFTHLLSTGGSVPVDFVTESFVPSAKRIPKSTFRTSSLVVWYDYFSVPQLENRYTFGADDKDGSQQARAINSIPAYVARCKHFLALCPTLKSDSKVLGAMTWSQRGWCRVERAARELSPDSTWILIKSSSCLEVLGGTTSFPTGPVGEGNFSNEEDRQKLAPVMRSIVMRKMLHCLKTSDFPGFRRQLNLQSVHFRGLEAQPIDGVLDVDNDVDAVSQFLFQNGFRNVRKPDTAGWWPIHYAALSGKAEVIRGLLQLRASVNQRTSKPEPNLGIAPWMSALDLAVLYVHRDATLALISAGAKMEGGVAPAQNYAAMMDNVEGLRALRAAGARPEAIGILGHAPLEVAAGMNSLLCVEEVGPHASTAELNRALGLTAMRGGSVELVQHLISNQADVNCQYDLARELNGLFRFAIRAAALAHRCGKVTVFSTIAYHLHGSTPLMHAVRMANYEAAAALIANGARLDLRDSRGFCVADFAKDQSIPRFLQKGLDGDPSECERFISLAFQNGMIEDPKREPQKGTTMETIGRNFLISFLLQQGQSYSSDGTSQKAGILTVTFPSCMLRPRLALSPTP
ncbi:ANK2 [Symbiodinium sp. KB8]|nr:ANK2 [Symbiodinium sp. KB8]